MTDQVVRGELAAATLHVMQHVAGNPSMRVEAQQRLSACTSQQLQAGSA